MLDKYAAKQEELKEEPVEVGEDIDSVGESDDEDDEDSLECEDQEKDIDIDQLMEAPLLEANDGPKSGATKAEIGSAGDALKEGDASKSIDSRPSSNSEEVLPSAHKEVKLAYFCSILSFDQFVNF